MSNDEAFVTEYQAGAARLATQAHLDLTEHDACGVGLVAALDGKPRRAVVQAGIDALRAVWHRGAVDADGKTGDGALGWSGGDLRDRWALGGGGAGPQWSAAFALQHHV